MLLASSMSGADFYVSPSGSPFADGSKQAAWDLRSAMSHRAEIQPGDTIWLLAGTYSLSETLVSSLVGDPDAPIVVRAYPNQRARLDCVPTAGPACFEIGGAHTWYWGFEIFNSSNVREVTAGGSAADPRGVGIHSRAGLGTRLINLVVHDVGTALFESQRSGIEIYGLIAYNNGWDGPGRSHGPGIYIRNRTDYPAKLIEDSIVFQNFRQGLQGFGSTPNVFSHFLVAGSVFFNNGIGRDGFHRNLMFGNASADHVGNVFRHNLTYFSPGLGAGSNMLGSPVGGCRELTVEGNVFAHGPSRTALEINGCEAASVVGNFFYGQVQGVARTSDNLFVSGDEWPTGVQVFVRPNRYEPERAQLAVLNWDQQDLVAVNLSSLKIQPGSKLTIRSVQDLFGASQSMTYSAGLVAIPMTGWSAAKPIGLETKPLPPTLPELGVFILTWKSVRPAPARSRSVRWRP